MFIQRRLHCIVVAVGGNFEAVENGREGNASKRVNEKLGSKFDENVSVFEKKDDKRTVSLKRRTKKIVFYIAYFVVCVAEIQD